MAERVDAALQRGTGRNRAAGAARRRCGSGDLSDSSSGSLRSRRGSSRFRVSPVDAAVGTITVDRTDNVLQIGPAVYETRAPALGMAVQKRGRTTGFTQNGQVTSINVTVTVNYGTAAAPVNGLIGTRSSSPPRTGTPSPTAETRDR